MSVDSPLAQALMGRKIGDTVSFQTPAGVKIAKVISVE
ncbi:GreA/GreB family elongation factor [Patescibacteria group bacterium]|nr:GreA/GreB family elongation factor [Patescibacteria group bacterium]MBU1868506.1 GreA/GreB family elongation factor [Patescibacteria group bacterium]